MLFRSVVGDEHVRPAVAVEVGARHPQPRAARRAEAGLARHVLEARLRRPAVVEEAGGGIAEAPRRAVVRPGGRVATLETAEPASPVLRAGHHIWFRRVVPFVGATLAKDAEAYEYLPRSTAYLPPPGDLLTLVEAAGFAAVERRTFTAGAVQLITGTRR